jgi:hypothetical protein
MQVHHRVEVALIPVAVAAVALGARWLPTAVGSGELLAGACLAWLVQGGLRDAWLLYRMKSRPDGAPRRRLPCMCLESSAGFTGVIVGGALAALGRGGSVTMTPLRWATLAAAVFALGFWLREVVITWRPLGLRREPDHHTIVFTWW